MDKNSVVTDQDSMEGENGGSVTENVVEEGCNGLLFTCEQVKHVTYILATQVIVGKVNEETVIVNNSLDSQRLENLEEKPEEVLQVEDVEVREDILSNDTTTKTNEMPMKELEKETTKKLTKKDEKRTRNPPKNPANPTSIPSVATRLKDNGRPAKACGIEKRSSTNTRGVGSNVRAEKQQKELSESLARPVEEDTLAKEP